MTRRVYLAGPITGLSFNAAADWRDQVVEALGFDDIEAFSPLRAKHYLRGEASIDGSVGAYPRAHPLSAPSGICARDRNDVARADVVLMNLLGAGRVSIGSMIEIGWADAYRKPLVLVIEPVGGYDMSPPGGAATDVKTVGATNPHHHAMVDELAAYVVHELEAGVEIVRALLLT